jgi:hypothetical protein
MESLLAQFTRLGRGLGRESLSRLVVKSRVRPPAAMPMAGERCVLLPFDGRKFFRCEENAACQIVAAAWL